MDDLQDFVLPAGTVIKLRGIPLELVNDIVVRCHPDNWPLTREQLGVSEVGAAKKAEG